MKTKSKNKKIDLPPKKSVFKAIKPENTEEIQELETGMAFHDAIHLVEGHDTDGRFEKAWKVIEKRLAITEDDEGKATCYYYLLRLLLRERPLFENKQAKDLYQRMWEHLLVCEKKYKQEFTKAKDSTDREIIRSQMEAFYQLADSYFTALEKIYLKRGFMEAKERTYENKMYFRKRFAFFSGRHFKHLAHFFLDKTSRYGHSFGRWGITVILFISIFAGIYGALDHFSDQSMFEKYEGEPGIFNYFYYSIVTFTTLGYGDIVPVNMAEKLVAGVEVLLGFIMLGVFINLIQRRL